MAVNTLPVLPLTPVSGWATLTTGNTAKDGTAGTTLVLTAGANGAWVEGLRFQPLGTNVQTVCRVFLNNGASPAVAANNTLWYEQQLPATTISETVAQDTNSASGLALILARAIPATYRLYVVLSTTVAAGWQVTGNSGNY